MAAAEQDKVEQIKHETFEEHIKQIQYDADTFDGKAFQEKFLAEGTLKEHNSVVIAMMKTEEIEYNFDKVEEGLGRSYTVYDFLVNLSTTVGRAMTLGNKFIITTKLAGIEVDVDEVGKEGSDK